MKSRALWGVLAGLSFLATPCVNAQILKSDDASQADVLLKGTVVAGNIQTAIAGHLALDPAFSMKKQQPEEKYPDPKMLVLKDRFLFDWTAGQQARHLMEDLRQGIHILQSVDKPRGFDVIALAGAREYWPKMRDISCRETPGIRYYDLDGFEQYCPAK
jgi:hypothetical protein